MAIIQLLIVHCLGIVDVLNLVQNSIAKHVIL
jgi:hypothetical protein